MPKRLDLTGQKFGRLSVVAYSHTDNGKAYWKCVCDCGNQIVVRGTSLRSKEFPSCGCYKRVINEIDNRYGRLLVISFSNLDEHGNAYWNCICDCGQYVTIIGTSLRRNHTQSCGCLHTELLIKRCSGKNSNFWRGGGSSNRQKYPSDWTNELRESIRNRDDRKCQFQDCEYNDTKNKIKLSVHHIDGNKNNCQEYNLISLCNSHHRTIENSNPSLWIDYFYQITRDYQTI